VVLSSVMAVVTHGGGKQLEEPVVVRPTSETITNEALLPEIGPPLDPHTLSALGSPAQQMGRHRPVAVRAADRELDRP
jgi:hypothetical protein